MFFCKVNAFLDRNDVPLNGLATIQGYEGQCTPLVEKLYPNSRAHNFALKCNHVPSLVMNCTSKFSQIACMRQVALHSLYLDITIFFGDQKNLTET